MDPSTWSRLRPILEAAVDRAEGEREAFVRSACAADAELCEQALRHLRAEGSGGVLADATPIGARAAAAAGMAVAGAQVGPWRLVRELGRGGMGEVWLAERADGAVEQEVALKRIPGHLGSEEVRQRFRREQRVLAGLEHPGIARLIDAGCDDSGQPYLAMEYVEGRPIDDWCSARGLGLRERIALFREVCAAVAYAHRKLVVHRDIKPANILVDDAGRPVLLDFGIARLLVDDTELTRTGEARYTPHYASLEQVRGESVGTQSDVYSLGVVLYELLAGRRPHRFDTGSATEVLRVLSERDPPPPSSVAGDTRRQLVGDLDAICLFALRREPERRYGSVEALSADLGRQLDGLPVQARPDTMGYRTRKFLRRHGVPVGAAAALALALIAGLAGTAHQYLRAEAAREAEAEQKQLALSRAAELERLAEDLVREQAAAERHFADVRRFSTELIFEVESSLRREGPARGRERLTTLGLEHLDKLAAEAEDDAELRAELAAAYLQMGDVLGSRIGPHVGRTAEAARTYEAALALLREHPDGGELQHEGWLLAAQACHKLADVHLLHGRTDEARAALEEGLAYLGDRAGAADASGNDLVLASVLVSGLRRVETGAGRLEQAQRLLDDELELTALLLERYPDRPAALQSRAVSLIEAAELCDQRRDNAASRRYVEDACLLLEDAVRRAPGHPQMRRELCSARLTLGEKLSLAGEPGEAAWVLDETLAWIDELAENDPGNQQLQFDLVLGLLYLSKVRLQLREPDAALQAGRRAHETAVSLAARDPEDVRLWSLAGSTAIQWARALIGLERQAEARAMLERALEHTAEVRRRAPDDPQRRRLATQHYLQIAETTLKGDDAGLDRGRHAVELGLALAAEARAEGAATPLDAELERLLRSADDELAARLADAD